MHTNISHYREMLVHTALCTHKDPKTVLIVSNESNAIADECSKYDALTLQQMDEASFKADIHTVTEKSIDVLIIDATLQEDKALFAHINAALADDALMVCRLDDFDTKATNESILSELGSYFKIIMPFFKNEENTLLLTSKMYHPTADIILHRSDLLEENSYYNADLHVASFAMPTYIKQNYLGAIRN